MEKFKNLEVENINKSELSNIQGGWWLEAAGVVVGLCQMAYQYGKDAAERERRLNHQ